MRKKLIVNLILLCTASSLSAPILADDAVVNDYAAQGIRMGAFTAKPSLELGSTWNSNIFNGDSNVRPDTNAFITHVMPSLNVASNWNRHSVDLTVRSDIQNYIDHPHEDRQIVDIGLNGRLDVMRDSFAYTHFGYLRQPEQRGAPDSPVNAIKPTGHEALSGQVGYNHKFNRIDVDISNLTSHDQFQNGTTTAGAVILNDQNRSRLSNTSALRVGYELTPGYEAFVKGSYNFINYDSKYNQQGYQRSSKGYNVVTGIALELTGKLTGNARVGYQSQQYDDPRLKDASGVAGGMTLRWTPTGLTTVTADVNRAINETTQLGPIPNTAYSSVFATSATAKVDHELQRNVVLSANAGYTYNQYMTSDPGFATRTDDIYTAGASAKYLINRYFFTNLSYQYAQRFVQNVSGVNYNNNSVSLGIGSQF